MENHQNTDGNVIRLSPNSPWVSAGTALQEWASYKFFPNLDGRILKIRDGHFVEIHSRPLGIAGETPQGINLTLTMKDSAGNLLLQHKAHVVFQDGSADKPVSVRATYYSGEQNTAIYGHVLTFANMAAFWKDFFEAVELNIPKR